LNVTDAKKNYREFLLAAEYHTEKET